MISVITATNRPGGVDINYTSLRRQTHKDFEWVFCDTLYDKRHKALLEYTKNDSRVKHYPQSKKDPKAKTWLAHAENEAISHAKGELIVMLQDYIHIEPTALEKFWYQYNQDKKRMITGVGHQYGKPGKEDITNINGMITLFKKPFEGMPEVIVWQDPRIRQDQGSFYKCNPNDWEVNYACAPRKMFYDVGGFDEEYDFVGFAFDNCSVAQRAFMLGYDPYIDQTNISYSVRHDDFFSNKAKNNDDFIKIATFHHQRMREIAEGKRNLKYNFLDKTVEKSYKEAKSESENDTSTE